MPRAVLTKDRLYTPQIVSLQTLRRLAMKDERIPIKVRNHMSACVDYLVTALSNAHTSKLDNEI
jgi:hypothetical protein